MIVKTPGVYGGEPRVDGTRIPVGAVVNAGPVERALEWWPHLTREQVEECHAYAAEHPEEFKPEPTEEELQDEVEKLRARCETLETVLDELIGAAKSVFIGEPVKIQVGRVLRLKDALEAASKALGDRDDDSDLPPDIQAELARLEGLTDEQILEEAKARGVDVHEQAARVKAMLLETARKTIDAKARLMADPRPYRGPTKPRRMLIDGAELMLRIADEALKHPHESEGRKALHRALDLVGESDIAHTIEPTRAE